MLISTQRRAKRSLLAEIPGESVNGFYWPLLFRVILMVYINTGSTDLRQNTPPFQPLRVNIVISRAKIVWNVTSAKINLLESLISPFVASARDSDLQVLAVFASFETRPNQCCITDPGSICLFPWSILQPTSLSTSMRTRQSGVGVSLFFSPHK